MGSWGKYMGLWKIKCGTWKKNKFWMGIGTLAFALLTKLTAMIRIEVDKSKEFTSLELKEVQWWHDHMSN